MRDERRPGLDGPGRMVKSREFGPQNYVSYEIWGHQTTPFKLYEHHVQEKLVAKESNELVNENQDEPARTAL